MGNGTRLRVGESRVGTARAPLVALLVAIVLCSAPAAAGESSGTPEPTASAERQALAVMDAFLAAFNARDPVAWADTVHFPHVRLASGEVRVYPDRQTFIDAMDLDAFARTTGWRYSTWDQLSVVQAGTDKVHIAVRFSRFDDRDQRMATYESLYVVERVDGRWGVRARSSFAP